MNLEPSLSIAKSIVAKAVSTLPELALATEDAYDRVLSLEDAAVGRRLRLASDGLSLSQKMSLERAILQAFTNEGYKLAGINFAKTQASTSGTAQPVPQKSRHGALGVIPNKKAIPGVRHVVVVASGKGGVGKSTVSANLAVSLASLGYRVGLMDCDVYGPSVPLLLGIRGDVEVGPGGKLIPKVGHGVKAMSFGFLSDVKTPVIWRGPLVSKAVEQFCYDVDWGDLDVLIIDMPPGTGDVQMTIAERLPIHAAVVVTTPQDVALIDAHKAVTMFEKLEVPIAGVVENMAWHTCSNCGHNEAIFGEDAFLKFLQSRALTLLTRIPLDKEIRVKSDLGTPPSLSPESREGLPYRSLAGQVATYLDLRPSPLH